MSRIKYVVTEYVWPLFWLVIGLAMFAIALAYSIPEAKAVPAGPNSCVSGFSGFGGFRDCDLWPDGSFYHEWWGGFIGYGGGSGRVCDSPRGTLTPPPTDSDPATKCPGW